MQGPMLDVQEPESRNGCKKTLLCTTYCNSNPAFLSRNELTVEKESAQNPKP